MIFKVEYEIPPLRAIYYKDVTAEDEEEARKVFLNQKYKAKIRKITRL